MFFFCCSQPWPWKTICPCFDLLHPGADSHLSCLHSPGLKNGSVLELLYNVIFKTRANQCRTMSQHVGPGPRYRRAVQSHTKWDTWSRAKPFKSLSSFWVIYELCGFRFLCFKNAQSFPPRERMWCDRVNSRCSLIKAGLGLYSSIVKPGLESPAGS